MVTGTVFTVLLEDCKLQVYSKETDDIVPFIKGALSGLRQSLATEFGNAIFATIQLS